MTYKSPSNCLFYLFSLATMLFFQSASAQPDFNRVDQWFQTHVPSLGGKAVLLVWKDGKLLYNKSWQDKTKKQSIRTRVMARKAGTDQREGASDFNENTIVKIASCSKWLSAALVMTFVDEGKLKVTDTIGKFLHVMSAHGKGGITIEQCLSHTTGIEPGKFREGIQEITKAADMNEAMNNIAQRKMESKPGASFHYSNIGLQIAAAVIEKIGASSFQTLFEQRIAAPCEMLSTDFGKSKVPLAAGGARGNAIDYLHFTTMLLQNGMYKGKMVLSAESVALMQRNYTSALAQQQAPAEAGKWGYGFGEWIMDDSKGSQRANVVSSPGMFGSFPWIDNRHQYTAVMFTLNLNNKGRHERYQELKKLVDEAIAGKKVLEKPTNDQAYPILLPTRSLIYRPWLLFDKNYLVPHSFLVGIFHHCVPSAGNR